MVPSVTPFTRILGCDVGDAMIVVHDTASSSIRKIPHHPGALAAFAADLDQTCLVVCEATGGYELDLLAALLAAGVPAHRADARKVKAFIRSFGTLGKTDDLDARALARYGQDRGGQLTLWRARDEQRVKLQALVLLRQDLVDDRHAYKNRRKAPGAAALAGIIDPIIEAFSTQIETLEKQIEEVVASCEAVARSVTTLTGICGVGFTTAVSLIALLPELGHASKKQIAALAGLAPHPDQSGAADRYRRTRGGRQHLKPTLFMAAMAAARHHPTLKIFFKRLIEKGKKRLVALTAVMRKIVVIANAQIKTENRRQLS